MHTATSGGVQQVSVSSALNHVVPHLLSMSIVYHSTHKVAAFVDHMQVATMTNNTVFMLPAGNSYELTLCTRCVFSCTT